MAKYENKKQENKNDKLGLTVNTICHCREHVKNGRQCSRFNNNCLKTAGKVKWIHKIEKFESVLCK